MEPLGLYIHIPFCKRKCHYCDFVSYPGKDDHIDDYISALISEASLYSDYLNSHNADTIFIGGGTPSLLSSRQIESLFKGVQSSCKFDLKEATIEANPETLDDEKLKIYAELGINRLSIGLQTDDDEILQNIGRRHTYAAFLKAYDNARKYFGNINIDLIFGLPGQTKNIFDSTLDNVLSLKPEHISAYSLKIEPGTKISETFCGADDEADRGMYHMAAEKLKEAGYEHYETSNFARPGFECLHNLKYWTGGEYLGLGAAAHSYIFENEKYRLSNITNLDDYITAIKNRKKPAIERYFLNLNDEKTEYIMLRLRLKRGIVFNEYNSIFNGNFLEEFKKPIAYALNSGLITCDESGIYPTLLGFDLQNFLITEFIKLI